MQRKWITVHVMSAIVLCLWVCPQPVSAFLTINLNYVGTALSEPSYDPGGTQLMAMMNAAAEQWGRATGIINDNHVISIDISWADLSDTNGTLGLHTNLDGGPVPRPTTARIQMDTQLSGVNRNWYFDPTPTDHSEFNLTQTVYGNLSAAQQSSWFNGGPPLMLEAGFAGGATATAPAAAQNGPDMLSVALHEMGHALGMTDNVAAAQTGDGDYDVNPAFVSGFTMGITDDGTYHLPQTNTVMAPGINSGIRRLPSATDVFAVASASGWSDLFLDRTDYLGGAVFSDPSAWVGGKKPNFTADATVRSFGSGGFAVAQSSMQFKNLSVFDAWSITALPNNIVLDVSGTTTIDGIDFAGGSTRIVLQGNAAPGSLLNTTDLMLLRGGRLKLDGQIPLAAASVDRTLEIDQSSSIFGHGFVMITNDVATDRLNNHGLIEADGGELRLAASNTVNPVFDLDGDDPTQTGNIRAVTGDLSVYGLHVGEFAGFLRVGGGHIASFEHRFVIGTSGDVRLDGNLVDPATVSGADLVLRGRVIVDKLGRVGRTGDLTTFESPVQISVPQVDDELRLGSSAVFSGGLYDGAGTIRQDDDLTVVSDTQIDTATYDWGNSVPLTSNDTLVEAGATFTINSPTTGTPGNEYRGVIRLENGVLEVNTTSGWTLPAEEGAVGVPPVPRGALVLQDRKSSSDMPTVRGQAITLGGLLLTNGGPGAVESYLSTEATGEIDVRIGADLLLKGVTTYNGGNIHGGGTLRQIGNASIVGNTTIATTITDWDGNEGLPSNTFIQPGVLFQITGSQIDDTPDSDGYDGTVTVSDTAALVVTTAGQWRLDGTMLLQGQQVAVPQAIVDGSTLLNFGTLQGNGWFQMPVISGNTIRPGQSAGAIRFEQDLTLNGNSLLDFEIGGIVPITQFDQISTGGSALLAGMLELSVINGFIPFPDHEFDIILSGMPVLGTFSSIQFPTMPGLALGIRYGTNTVTVTTGLIGDLNGDGFVGIDDLNIVLGGWNGGVDAGVWGMGDPSGDGFIGIEDLNAVLGNWNAGTPPPGVTVPEPATSVLLGGLGAVSRLRRRRTE
jgi:hypothetical protein